MAFNPFIARFFQYIDANFGAAKTTCDNWSMELAKFETSAEYSAIRQLQSGYQLIKREQCSYKQR